MWAGELHSKAVNPHRPKKCPMKKYARANSRSFAMWKILDSICVMILQPKGATRAGFLLGSLRQKERAASQSRTPWKSARQGFPASRNAGLPRQQET